MHPMRRLSSWGKLWHGEKMRQTLHRLRKLHSPSSMSWHFPAETAFSHSSTIHLKRRSLRFGCAFAGFMALKPCITTRKRCIAAFAPAMNRLRRSGSTPIWSKPLMGISRFMRNGKQRPTLWVENERATSGTRLRLTVNQMMPSLWLWNSNCCTDSFALK